MKRLLLPLVGALVLATSVNAAPTYVFCLINESRYALIDDYKAVKRKVGMVKIPNSKFKPWKKRAAYHIDYYNFTFNEGNQEGYVKLSDGSMKKLDFINFMPESITITNPLYGYTSYGSDGMEERFKISRVDGSIFKQGFSRNDTFVSEGRGTCKKSESKNTLF
tara:strand:+ start:187 stop:678 length:492 start_codon:yes stop_codon:yes gene_type:complete